MSSDRTTITRSDLVGRRHEILRLAARSEFDGKSSEPVQDWLEPAGSSCRTRSAPATGGVSDRQ